MQRHRLVGIDPLRFIAACLVMVFHLAYASWAGPDGAVQSQPAFPELTAVSWFGWVGVEIFFVISGFVIAYSAEGSSAVLFLRRRLLRLLPAALVCASITLAVAWALGQAPAAELLRRYLNSLWFSPVGPWIDHSYWTLGVEVLFYAIIFGLLAVSRPQWIEGAAYALGGASLLLWIERGLARAFHLPAYHAVIEQVPGHELIEYGGCFAIGMIVWAGWRKGWTTARWLAFAAFLLPGAAPILAGSTDPDASSGVVLGAWLPLAVWLLSLAVLLLSIRHDAAVARWTARYSGVTRTIGLATYPLYLIHQVVGIALMRALFAGGWNRFAALVAGMTAMLGLSVAVVILAEPAVKEALGRLLDGLGRLVRTRPAPERG